MSAAEVIAGLKAGGFESVEVYRKRGRSRRVDWSLTGTTTVLAEEAGWAVRAGDDRSSLFLGATGEPRLDLPWPDPGGEPLRLPHPRPSEPWAWPSGLDVPLIGEREALALVGGIESALVEERRDARLLEATLEDGSSEAWIESSTGLQGYHRFRLAALRLSAMGRSGSPVSVSLASTARAASDLAPRALARRLVDLLAVHEKREKGSVPSGRGALLAPEVAARLLGGLVPALLGAEAWRHLRTLQGDDSRLASDAVNLVDDGRLPGGLLASPIDGEGVPTREVRLVERGRVRQPLLPWWQESAGAVVAGCSRRASWRDTPQPGPTHLYLRPDPRTGAASLLERLGEGAYLIDAGEPSVDLEKDRIEMAVAGFVLAGGRPVGPLAPVRLGGSVRALLRGIVAVARDLRFVASGAMIGAPSVLVQPLEWLDG